MKQGWEIKKLGEVCSINYGTRVVQKKDGGTIFPVYGGGGATFRMDKYNREDCLVVSRFAMSSQCVRYVVGKFFLNDSGLTIESNSPKLKQSFLDKHIIAYNDKIYSLGKGAAQRNLDIKALKEVSINYPPIAEQEKIVAELDCLSGIIEKKKQQLKELDNLAQSIFYEMFGNPVENDKGWKVLKLKELSSLIINGTTPKGGAEVYVDNGILFLRSQNVWRNHIDYEDVAHIDEKTNASMKKSILHKHDILITKTGRINTENSSLGRAALFEGETGSANINGHVYLIRINEKLVLPRFVLSILTGIAYRDYIRKVCVGGIDKRQINKEHVEEFPIIIPSVSMQKQYVETVEAIEKQKELIKQSIQETETLFNSRMDYYFN